MDRLSKIGAECLPALHICWLVTLSLVVGCGADDGKVRVAGKVQLDGKPLARASIGFISGNGASLTSAVSNDDGYFVVRLYPGLNKISVSQRESVATKQAENGADQEDVSPTDGQLARMRAKQQKRGPLPSRYANPNQSGLSCQVQEDMELLEITLSFQVTEAVLSAINNPPSPRWFRVILGGLK